MLDLGHSGNVCSMGKGKPMLRCPVYVTRRVEGTQQLKHRVLCDKPAANYEVQGDSFSCKQVLCPEHATKARKEGFRLYELKETEA